MMFEARMSRYLLLCLAVPLDEAPAIPRGKCGNRVGLLQE